MSTLTEAKRREELDIVALRPSDWAVLKMVRLRSLRDSPKAFVAAHRFECRLDRANWRARLEDGSTWVIARAGLDRQIVGIAHLGAEPVEDHVGMDPSSAVRYVESVWVHPRARRQGVLRRMIEELELRARAEPGVRKLLLWVFDDNHVAWDAYLRLGFEPMGQDESNYAPAPDAGNRGVWERRMSKGLPGL